VQRRVAIGRLLVDIRIFVRLKGEGRPEWEGENTSGAKAALPAVLKKKLSFREDRRPEKVGEG